MESHFLCSKYDLMQNYSIVIHQQQNSFESSLFRFVMQSAFDSNGSYCVKFQLRLSIFESNHKVPAQIIFIGI